MWNHWVTIWQFRGQLAYINMLQGQVINWKFLYIQHEAKIIVIIFFRSLFENSISGIDQCIVPFKIPPHALDVEIFNLYPFKSANQTKPSRSSGPTIQVTLTYLNFIILIASFVIFAFFFKKLYGVCKIVFKFLSILLV